MATFQSRYPIGSYVLRIKENTLGETATGTPFVAIQVEVVSGKNIKDHSVIYGGTRTVNLWLTEKALPYTKAFLEAAGFTGSIAQLDLDHPDHFSLEGYEADGSCKLNEFNGKTYDQFGFFPPKAKFGAKLNKVNTSRLLALDCLFGTSVVQAPKKTAQKPVSELPPSDAWQDDESCPF